MQVMFNEIGNEFLFGTDKLCTLMALNLHNKKL